MIERPLVHKFGGSCFLDLADYRTVADFIAASLADSGRLVAVASAMSGTTGNLINTLHELDDQPRPELTAQLQLAGETVSAVLLATALIQHGIKTRVLEPFETGITTAGPSDLARVVRIDPAPLWQALATCRVLVVPGGYAADADGHAVTMGRNSSDLSAIAAAVALGAPSCDLFSDVPGVFTADPYLLPEARLIRELGYGTARRMAESGAKVVHTQAVDLAEEHNLAIVCRMRPPDGSRGTVIAGTAAPVAVVAATRSSVWALTDARTAETVLERLRGQAAFLVDHEGLRHLVLPDGPARETAGWMPGTPRPDLRLLTTVFGEREPERVLVLEADLVIEARRRHAMHYSSHPPGGKARSALSDLLMERGPDG